MTQVLVQLTFSVERGQFCTGEGFPSEVSVPYIQRSRCSNVKQKVEGKQMNCLQPPACDQAVVIHKTLLEVLPELRPDEKATLGAELAPVRERELALEPEVGSDQRTTRSHQTWVLAPS